MQVPQLGIWSGYLAILKDVVVTRVGSNHGGAEKGQEICVAAFVGRA